MSMQEPTDDQLDGLFRKSGEEFDIPFDPAAWQDMKSRLDNHDRYSAWEHMFRWGIPVLLLLIMTAGSWNAYHKQVLAASLNRQLTGRSNSGSLPGAVAATPVPPATPNQPAALNQTGLNAEQGVQTRRPAESINSVPADQTAPLPVQPDGRKWPALTSEGVPAINQKALPELTNNSSRPAPDDDRNRVVDASTITPVTDNAVPNRPTPEGSTIDLLSTTARNERTRSGVNRRSKKRAPGDESVRALPNNMLALPYPARSYTTKARRAFTTKQTNTGAGTYPDAPESLPANDLQAPADAATTASARLLSFDALTNRPGLWPKPLPFKGRDVVAPTPETEQPMAESASTRPTPSSNGFSVRLLVSPDLSSIGLRELQRPGTNVGVMAEYRLAARWSLQAGILRSTKVYKAYPSDYEWPSTWTSATRPLSVDGSCRMFDIPINLRYDLVVRPRSDGRLPDRWFLSGGATTYYISREDYVYAYPAHTYNVPKEWRGRTGWNGFSQLNLSGGFERSFSRRLSWQVEPFMKLPLKGVGLFKIDLLSTGAFFSLRYKL